MYFRLNRPTVTTNVVQSFHISPPADGAHGHGAVVRPNHGGDVPEDLLVSLDIALCDHKSSNTRRFAFYEMLLYILIYKQNWGI